MITVPVRAASSTYEVSIGSGAAKLLAESVASARCAAIVTQEEIGFEVDPEIPAQRFYLPPGEEAKSLTWVEHLCRVFANAGLSRSDLVVAVGGGVVTDVAGFASAVYLRGVRLVNVPTTLLAQVDAAIGGKTAVNLPEGKNLVGAFWQPAAVLCDTDALDTLPRREWVSGRAEMAKCVFLGGLLPGTHPRPGDPGAYDYTWLEDSSLEEQIARCVRIKAAVVSKDEREASSRALLNYGHTLAHALEIDAVDAERPDALRHGEAVAIGLVFAARLARRLRRIDDDRVKLHEDVLASLDLDADAPGWSSSRRLVELMARDKKADHDLTFVLDGPNGPEVVHAVAEDDVVATLSEMGFAP